MGLWNPMSRKGSETWGTQGPGGFDETAGSGSGFSARFGTPKLFGACRPTEVGAFPIVESHPRRVREGSGTRRNGRFLHSPWLMLRTSPEMTMVRAVESGT